MKQFSYLFLSIFLTTSTSLNAHDFWLEAQPFYQKINNPTEISLHVGENMGGELLPNIPAWYEKFDVITAEGLKPVDGEMGRDPAGFFSHKTEGVYAIGYLSSESSVNLEGYFFNAYLKKQGLEKIIKQREKSGEFDMDGREVYTRNVKTLIKIGDKYDVDFHDYDFGYPLNIKPLQNPYTLKIGGSLKVQVTFNQKPAANLLLKAQIKNNPLIKHAVRTDEQGYAILPINAKGVWLIHTVEMIRSNKYEIEWESFWGSLTFEVR